MKNRLNAPSYVDWLVQTRAVVSVLPEENTIGASASIRTASEMPDRRPGAWSAAGCPALDGAALVVAADGRVFFQTLSPSTFIRSSSLRRVVAPGDDLDVDLRLIAARRAR